MSNDNSSSLSELIKKFSQDDVILQMEKQYRNVAAVNLLLEKIDDNAFVSKIVFAEKTIALLGTSIAEKGIFSPLVVRPTGDRYELILGRKRYFGAKQAGLIEVPVIVKEVGDEETLLMLLADTRDDREGNIVEMALVFEVLQKSFGYSQATLGNLTHQSRSQVTNIMRLLSLPAKVITEVVLGHLSYGHARALLSLKTAEALDSVKIIHEKKLSVRETEAFVKRYHRDDGGYEKEALLIAKSGAQDVRIKTTAVSFDFSTSMDKEAFIKRYLDEEK